MRRGLGLGRFVFNGSSVHFFAILATKVANKGRNEMTERDRAEGQGTRLKRVRVGKGETPQEGSAGEETRQGRGGEEANQQRGGGGDDALRKVQSVGRRIAEGFRGGGAAEGQGIPDQIRHLARLRDEGHINDAEFEDKKRELLERM